MGRCIYGGMGNMTLPYRLSVEADETLRKVFKQGSLGELTLSCILYCKTARY